MSSGQPFPMSKLVFMYVKRLAEPLGTVLYRHSFSKIYKNSLLALRIQLKAEESETFKKIICLPPANLFHFYEVKIKFRFMNIGKVRMKQVPKMTEKRALELGANLFAEFCFYAVASAIALNEVMKYKVREKEKDESVELDTNELLENVDRLNKLVESQICDIKR